MNSKLSTCCGAFVKKAFSNTTNDEELQPSRLRCTACGLVQQPPRRFEEDRPIPFLAFDDMSVSQIEEWAETNLVK